MKATTIDITAVTEEQIDRCHRVINENTHTPFYLVESERDILVEYKVEAILKDGEWYLTCTCPAGLRGIPCKHRRWAVAASEDFKELIKAEAQAQARIDDEKAPTSLMAKVGYTNVDEVTLARVLRRDAERKAQPKKPSRKVAYCQTRPAGFSLLKK
jgi:hypothetical protein